jgi:diguanylate cyclase (GGDEF)-like protein
MAKGPVFALQAAGRRTYSGDFVAESGAIWSAIHRFRLLLAGVIAAAVYSGLLMVLRNSLYQADPLLDTYLEMAGSLIAFTFAANAMVRFRGTHDRISLILAFGFVLAGLIEAGTSMTFYRGMLVATSANPQTSLGWLAGRTLLGVLLIAALFVEHRIPVSREPGKEIAGATLVVGAIAYLTSIFFFMMPASLKIHPGALFPRPWDLLPAGIFAAAAIGYGWRLRRADASLDRALFVAAILNALCHVTMSQSPRVLDAPYTLAHGLMVLSYVVVLGGTLLDNAQLFDQVSRQANSDPMTGLANHRQMFEILHGEIQRTGRTGRSFAVLLFDLDGLKKINDKYGHLTGTTAIKRLAAALRSSSRAIDTPARYGGDEFALILPESGKLEAQRAAKRICERLAYDGGKPPITVSVGVSVYPQDGTTVEKLLGAADVSLYKMKGKKGDPRVRMRHVAACL